MCAGPAGCGTGLTQKDNIVLKPTRSARPTAIYRPGVPDGAAQQVGRARTEISQYIRAAKRLARLPVRADGDSGGQSTEAHDLWAQLLKIPAGPDLGPGVPEGSGFDRPCGLVFEAATVEFPASPGPNSLEPLRCDSNDFGNPARNQIGRPPVRFRR